MYATAHVSFTWRDVTFHSRTVFPEPSRPVYAGGFAAPVAGSRNVPGTTARYGGSTSRTIGSASEVLGSRATRSTGGTRARMPRMIASAIAVGFPRLLKKPAPAAAVRLNQRIAFASLPHAIAFVWTPSVTFAQCATPTRCTLSWASASPIRTMIRTTPAPLQERFAAISSATSGSSGVSPPPLAKRAFTASLNAKTSPVRGMSTSISATSP